jgi:hypothetical protein
MLTAVQVAVVAAAVAFVAGIGVAVYVMLKAARLMSEASAAVTGLRERGDLLIDRANTTIDQAGEQIARTQTVTASMEGITATMADLGGHRTALAPPPAAAEASRGPLTWAAALAYGVRWALGMRRAAGPGGQPGRPWPGGAPQPRRPEPRRAERPGLSGRDSGRWAALAGRTNGTPR